MQPGEQRPVEPATVEAIYEAMKEAPERQIAAGLALDAKSVQVVGAASVVIGLIGVSSGLHSGGSGSTRFLWAALMAYAVVAALAILQVWPQGVRHSRTADQLWPEYRREPPAVIRHALVEDIHTAYLKNRSLVHWKVWTLRLGLVALASEVGLVAMAIIMSRSA